MAGKITAKTFSDIDFISYLKYDILSIENKPMSIKEQVKFEIDYLEYPVFYSDKFPEDFYIVVEYTTYKDKTKPYVILHNLKNGESLKTKVKDGKYYSEYPFFKFDVLKVNRFTQQFKTKKIGDKWQKTDELEDILSKWEVY